MTSKVELISVVIPTLNEAGTILNAINTIDQYTTYPKEIIVVDSNSTDGTIDLVERPVNVDLLLNQDAATVLPCGLA